MLKNLVKKIPGAERLAGSIGLVFGSVKSRQFIFDLLPEKSIGAEIGVHFGDFSEKILEMARPKRLHLIDPWKYESSEVYYGALYGSLAKNGQDEMDQRHANVCARFAEQVRTGQVKINRGYSAEILEQFPDEYFDWIYIDGNHLYEYVMKDLQLSFKKTKRDGLVMGDDYVAGQWWQGGVKLAVDEYAKNPAAELLELRARQFVFRRKA